MLCCGAFNNTKLLYKGHKKQPKQHRSTTASHVASLMGATKLMVPDSSYGSARKPKGKKTVWGSPTQDPYVANLSNMFAETLTVGFPFPKSFYKSPSKNGRLPFCLLFKTAQKWRVAARARWQRKEVTPEAPRQTPDPAKGMWP